MLLILVTCTYSRPGRIDSIKKIAELIKIRYSGTTRWIVVENGPQIDKEVQKILPENAIYLALESKSITGEMQRNYALEYIKNNNLIGIVYDMNEHNTYNPQIFHELRKMKKDVAFLPVGVSSLEYIEKPIISNGKFVRWEGSYLQRKYPVSIAGFAFNSKLLKNLNPPLWDSSSYGESETKFLEKILNNVDEAQFLCDDCSKVYVWIRRENNIFSYIENLLN